MFSLLWFFTCGRDFSIMDLLSFSMTPPDFTFFASMIFSVFASTMLSGRTVNWNPLLYGIET